MKNTRQNIFHMRPVQCRLDFDLQCANVSEKRFLNTMNTYHKCNWQCDGYKAKLLRSDKTNTPIRQREEVSAISYVTNRKKNTGQNDT